jgi:hypothetical protein
MSAELKNRITDEYIAKFLHEKAGELADHSIKTELTVKAIFPGVEFVSSSEIKRWLNEGWSFTFIAEGGNFVRDGNKQLKFFHPYWCNCHQMDLVVVANHYKDCKGKDKILKRLGLHKPGNPKDEITWPLASRVSKKPKLSRLEREVLASD